MVRRGSGAEFLGGAHVFPGGAVDQGDGSELAAQAVRFTGDPAERPWRTAALRELAEETGILLTDRPAAAHGLGGEALFRAVAASGAAFLADRLEYLSNWVTPLGPSRRYDTRFYVAVLGEETPAGSDGDEVFDAAWVSPPEALRRADAGEWYVEFPTRRHLELLAGFGSVEEMVDHARSTIPVRIEPRLTVGRDGSWRVLLPGDEGFAEAPS